MSLIVIAPHADDELIGCFSRIEDAHRDNKSIYFMYLYEIDKLRGSEAAACAQWFGAMPLFPSGLWEADAMMMNLMVDDEEQRHEVLVPSRRDAHVDHKEINLLFRKYATSFYSVDMVGGRPLHPKKAEYKRHLLNKLYPSQSVLWENNHSYFLFESIHDKDWDTYARLHFRRGDLSLLVEAEYEKIATDIVDTQWHKCASLEELFGKLMCAVRGRIELSDNKIILRG